MAQQTAMHELIERLKILSTKYQNSGLLTAIEIGEQLLSKEREQIIKTWCDCELSIIDLKPKYGEQYYNETYGE